MIQPASHALVKQEAGLDALLLINQRANVVPLADHSTIPWYRLMTLSPLTILSTV